MTRRTRRIGEFLATDPNGKAVIVHVYQDISDSKPFDDESVADRSNRDLSFRTPDGRTVTKERDGRYLLTTDSGLVPLTTKDPNAP